MLIKIIFDNNTSIAGQKNSDLSNIFSKNITDINKFIKNHNIQDKVKLFLTELVLKEGLAEIKKRIIDKYNKAKNSISQIDFLKEIIFIQQVDLVLIEEKTNEQFDLKIKENGLETLHLPQQLSLGDIACRAIEHTPPFEMGDKGFKDSIIWLSILEDAERNKNVDVRYILVTDDAVFYKSEIKDEFKKIICKEIIITTPDSLETIVDNELSLGIGLAKIKNEASKKIIMDVDFQNRLVKEGLSKSHSNNLIYMPSQEWRNRIVNLIYKETILDVKDKINSNLYKIDATVKFSPLYSNKELPKSSILGSTNDTFTRQQLLNPTYPARVNPYYNYGELLSDYSNPELVLQEFTFSYDKNTNKFEIIETGQIYQSLPIFNF